jgi:hypothetical protein
MHPTRRTSLACLLAAFGSLFAAGCGADTTTLSGTVTFNGRPVTGGSVSLYCADKQIVRGIIDADGRYSIPNVPFGTAVITVQSHTFVPAGMQLQQKLPESVNSPAPPALAGETAKKATPIPPRYSHPEESGLTVDVRSHPATHDIQLVK